MKLQSRECYLKDHENYLVKRDETRRVGGADTRPAVEGGLVGDGELAKVVANHLRLKGS